MNLTEHLDPKKTTQLFGYKNKFNFLSNLILEEKFPRVILFSGEKGIGKSTLINHLMYFYFDKENYDVKDLILSNQSTFYKQFVSNIFPNIFYFNGSNFKNVKIEDIRNLKKSLLSTSLNDLKRFVILDDVEIFNKSSLNALLKIIEEPNKNIHFILINNKSNSLLETIRSRSLEIKIFFNYDEKNFIITSLIEKFNQPKSLDENLLNISPGNFLRFNHVCNLKKINIEENFLINLSLILNFYKKDKDIFYKDLILYLAEYYLQKNKFDRKFNNKKKLIELRYFFCKKINDFFLYNLNQNTLLSSLENKLFK